MEKLKEFWKSLNPKVAMVGGALVVTTTLGTCQLMGSDEVAPTEEAEAPAEEAPAEKAPEEKSAEEGA
jgi:hypothetical protein|tara:strand:- start:419 stop:622 length:204 start_codon:yes stop_codon:yes gene_type:complete